MHQAIPDILKAFAPFTDYEIEIATPFLKQVSIKKGGFFSKAGMITDRIGFVSQGLLRSFYTIKGNHNLFLTKGIFCSCFIKLSTDDFDICQEIRSGQLANQSLHRSERRSSCWSWPQACFQSILFS